MAQEDCRGKELHEARGRHQTGTERYLRVVGTRSGATMKINFDKLKVERPTLYARITKEVNHEYAGELEFYPEVLGEEIAAELKAWFAAPSVHEATCSCDACFQKRVAENNAREKKRLAAKAAGARLLQYIQNGLLDNEYNRSKWSEFEAKLPKDVVLSPELIDQ